MRVANDEDVTERSVAIELEDLADFIEDFEEGEETQGSIFR